MLNVELEGEPPIVELKYRKELRDEIQEVGILAIKQALEEDDRETASAISELLLLWKRKQKLEVK